MARRTRRSGVAAAALTLLFGLLAVATPTGSAQAPRSAAVPVLAWYDCRQGLQCSTAEVPLDHDDPVGPTITIFMARRPADDQSHRVGSLFVNPGGPGLAASQFVHFFAQRLPAEVRARFDVIGIDPRGTGRSSALRCGRTPPLPALPREFVPLTSAQARRVMEVYRALADSCTGGSDPVVGHMSSADTARDMDLVRQAVGDPALTTASREGRSSARPMPRSSPTGCGRSSSTRLSTRSRGRRVAATRPAGNRPRCGWAPARRPGRPGRSAPCRM